MAGPPTGTVFPGALDTYLAVAGGNTITDVYANDQTSAILAIEATLGVNPQGSFSTVGDGVAAKSDATDIQTDALVYSADTGSASTYEVTLSPTPPAYTAGQRVVFVAANANTGSSTLEVNAGGPQNLLSNDGTSNLNQGDIVSGQVCEAVYDGTNFQLVSTPVTASKIQAQALTFGTDTGSPDSYQVSLTPPPAPYAAGQIVTFVAANSNDGPSTLNVNGQGNQNLVDNGGNEFIGGEIVAGQVVTAVYDGGQFQLVGGSGGGSSNPLGLPNTVNQLRLTVVSGEPIIPDSGSYGTMLYFTPYMGDAIGLYNGATWDVLTTSEISLDLTTLPYGNIVYDFFVQNQAGTPTLLAGPPWSDNQDRSTDIVQQDGVWVLGTDPTQRYVGSGYLDGSYNAIDTTYSRMLFNADNRVPRLLFVSAGTNSTNSNSWQDLCYASYVYGYTSDCIFVVATALGQGDGVSVACEVAVGLNGPDSFSPLAAIVGTGFLAIPYARTPDGVGIVYPIFQFRSTSSGTTVNILDDGAGNSLTNITGIVWV